MGFLLSRRWLLFAAVVALLAFAATQLGDWQFRRLTETRAQNRQIAHNIAAAPVPVGQVLHVGGDTAPSQEWRMVTAVGHWDTAHQVVIRYQSRDSDGSPGVNVVVPLRTVQGPALLVNRGWLGTPNVGTVRPALPPLQHGLVSVTGFVRVDGTGASTDVQDLSARAISSKAIAPVLPYPVYGGFLQLSRETPSAAVALGELELPVPGDGPHFFYGLQWWFFGALAVGGFLYLAFDELRRHRRRPGQHQPQQQRLAQPR